MGIKIRVYGNLRIVEEFVEVIRCRTRRVAFPYLLRLPQCFQVFVRFRRPTTDVNGKNCTRYVVVSLIFIVHLLATFGGTRQKY